MAKLRHSLCVIIVTSFDGSTCSYPGLKMANLRHSLCVIIVTSFDGSTCSYDLQKTNLLNIPIRIIGLALEYSTKCIPHIGYYVSDGTEITNVCMLTCSLPLSLTHSLNHLLAHSLIPSFIHLLTCSLTHSINQSLIIANSYIIRVSN